MYSYDWQEDNKQQIKGLAIYIISFFVIWFLYVLFGSEYLGTKINNPLLHKYLNIILKLIIFPLSAILYLKYYYSVNPINFLKFNTGFQKGLPYIMVAVILDIFVFVIASQFFHAKFNPQFDILLWLNGILLAGITEETVFRGFILQKANEFMSFGKANLVNAVLFLLIHFPQWLHANRITSLDVVLNMINIFCVGLALGYVFRKSNSLISCITIHSILNFIGLSLGVKP